MELTIDCRACPHRHTETCDDCIVTFVASREPDEALVVDAAEFAAVRRLAAARQTSRHAAGSAMSVVARR